MSDFDELKTMSLEKKREFIYNLDCAIERAHKNGCFINKFDKKYLNISNLNDPYFEEDNINTIPNYISYDDMANGDIINEAIFALELYMGEFLVDGVKFNAKVIYENFDSFQSFYPEQDVDYYRTLFENYIMKKEGPLVSFSSYVNKKEEGNSLGNGKRYSKSTEVGRSMAMDEDGNINYLFIFTIVTIVVVMLIGMLISFSDILF